MATITDSLSGAVDSASARCPGLPFSFPVEQNYKGLQLEESIQDSVHSDDSFAKLYFDKTLKL